MKYSTLNILFLLLACGCGQTTPPEAAVVAEASASGGSETIALTRTQLREAGIVLGQPELRPMSGILTANGAVAVLPENKAAVSAKLSGRIEYFFIHESQNVKKGQPLTRISSSIIFDIQKAYLPANADLFFLEKELARQKTLSAQNAGALKNYEEAQSKYQHAKVNPQTSASKLRYLGIGLEHLNDVDHLQLAQSIVVTAPTSGNITEVPVGLGLSVTEGNTLCQIVSLDELHPHVEVFAKDIALIRQGQVVSIHFPNTSFAPLSAKIEYIGQDINPESRTYALRVRLPAPKNYSYLPGMPVVADISTQSGAAVLALPEAAVLHDGKESYCFVVQSTDSSNGTEKVHFSRQSFEKTLSSGGWISVPAEQFKGKQVVIKGAKLVDGEMKSTEVG